MGLFKRELKVNTTSTRERFCNRFSVIQSRYTFKMCSDYPRIKWNQRVRDKQAKLNISHHNYAHVVHTTGKQIISRRVKNRNVFEISKVEKCMAKRKNYCFSLLNMQMCDVLVAVVVVVA